MLSRLMTAPKLRADFNGLFGDILCLSHSDICVDEHGVAIQLHAGMIATAFDKDLDANGIRDDLIANGIVEESPDWLQCRGSKWVLRIDGNGIRNESEINSVAERTLGADSPVSGPLC